MAGLIANRVDPEFGGTGLLEQFVETVGTKIIAKVPYHDLIRRSRLAGKTLFEMEGEGKEAATCDRPPTTAARCAVD